MRAERFQVIDRPSFALGSPFDLRTPEVAGGRNSGQQAEAPGSRHHLQGDVVVARPRFQPVAGGLHRAHAALLALVSPPLPQKNLEHDAASPQFPRAADVETVQIEAGAVEAADAEKDRGHRRKSNEDRYDHWNAR